MKRKAAYGEDNNVAPKRNRRHLGDPDDDFYDDSGFTSEQESDYESSVIEAPTPLTSRSGESPAPRQKFPSDYKTIRCTYSGCTKTFNRPQRLANHLRSHTGERPFKCEYAGCDKDYQEEKHLRQHVNASHTHEKKFECTHEGCDGKFPTASKLRRHEKVHTGKERFRCRDYPPCNQSFRKHQTLQRHIRSEHLSLPAYPCTHRDSTSNKACEAAFKSPSALRQHIKQEHGELRFWCEACGNDDADGIATKAGFPTEELLRKHLENDHFNCVFCPKIFLARDELENHVESDHSKPQTKVACPWDGCTKSYSKNSNLQSHIRSVHEGHRYVCGQVNLSHISDLTSWTQSEGCGKGFVTKGNLEEHVRHVHMGVPRPQPTHRSTEEHEHSPGDDILGLLSGLGGPTRNTMACTIPGCPRKFIHLPGLKKHLQDGHGLDADNITSSMHALALDPSFVSGFDLGTTPGLEQHNEGIFNGSNDLSGAAFGYEFEGLPGSMSAGMEAEWQNLPCHDAQQWQNYPEMGLEQQSSGVGDITVFIDPALEQMISNDRS